jgi:hypothetical protein
MTFDPSSWLWFSAWGPSGSDHEPIVFGNITADAWFQVSFTFSTAFPVDHIAIYLTTTNWQGTLYIDSVTLTGP